MAGDRTAEFVWGWQGQMKTATDRAKHVLGNEFFSDVTFRVGPREGPTVDMKAHKLLLAMGSAVFETMFYGAIAETGDIVRITDIDERTFGILLRYIYHDEMPVFDISITFSTLYAAKKYGLPLLKTACEAYLKMHATAADCLFVFAQARAYDEQDLADSFLLKIDFWATSVLKSAEFTEISIDILKEILSRDTLRTKEDEMLHAAYRWAEHCCAQRKVVCNGSNCRDVLEDAMFYIRFPLLSEKELDTAAESGFLHAEEIIQLHQFRLINGSLPEKFITKKRNTPFGAPICRFDSDRVGKRGDCLDECLHVIGLSVTSGMDAKGKKLDSASVSLFGIGIFSTVQISRSSAVLRLYDHSREMQEFRQTGALLRDDLESQRVKFALEKPVPLIIGETYIVTVRLLRMGEYLYGRGGKENVTATVGNYTVTVRLSDSVAPEGPGHTKVSEGQLPEFYLEIVQ